MKLFDSNSEQQRYEKHMYHIGMMHIDAYLRYANNWKKRLFFDFLSGIVRGVGFSIGFSFLGALLLYLLRNMALANMPVIGRFIADLVRIVEKNL